VALTHACYGGAPGRPPHLILRESPWGAFRCASSRFTYPGRIQRCLPGSIIRFRVQFITLRSRLSYERSARRVSCSLRAYTVLFDREFVKHGVARNGTRIGRDITAGERVVACPYVNAGFAKTGDRCSAGTNRCEVASPSPRLYSII
jgi:hypothetical protein